jgi:hypothetical protein
MVTYPSRNHSICDVRSCAPGLPAMAVATTPALNSASALASLSTK